MSQESNITYLAERIKGENSESKSEMFQQKKRLERRNIFAGNKQGHPAMI